MDDSTANRLTPASSADDLTRGERKAVDHQSRPSAALIHETIRTEGERELERSGFALMVSGLAAGLSIGFSIVVPAALMVALPDTPWEHILTSLGYTVGFLIVVLGRQQLFTENTLMPVLPLLQGPSWRRLGLVLRLWAIVLASNIAAPGSSRPSLPTRPCSIRRRRRLWQSSRERRWPRPSGPCS
ncbi:formate/nitrite transporter family protein [Antarcticirhabdus aurantiaca]|uniref:Formate/nitrite transporter family protein n=1 Tax=Antarcticirhabdus aurantiaca TaxID=2606717 RepID=A0ACD4NN70_9HYPH|nr:formate/nitrite transporter family protein [Antarcticirhabdus aurantiaca]WAJ28360.1 formate/nitrite transporter family protein [Jeongeuplla avenae]